MTTSNRKLIKKQEVIMNTMTKNTTRTTENTATEAGLDIIAKGTFGLIGGASAIIGVWAMASLIAAMVSVGPIGLIKSWFTAVGLL